jgi:pimeloyl-ACP methyl ester carboxylesterase
MIASFGAENPNTRFVLIGHSQGGLIALRGLDGAAAHLIDAVITLDGALAGAPPVETSLLLLTASLGNSCWGPAAALGMNALWFAPNTEGENAVRVLQAQQRGTRVLTIGNRDDCVWNPRRCPFVLFLPTFLLPNNERGQIIDAAAVLFVHLGGNCAFNPTCVASSHARVLGHPLALGSIDVFSGSPFLTP